MRVPGNYRARATFVFGRARILAIAVVSAPKNGTRRSSPQVKKRPSGYLRLGRAFVILFDNQRTHHVVFFMLEDVAVPDVFFPASPRTHRIAHRCCRQIWQVELRDHGRDFPRIHPHCIFPP